MATTTISITVDADVQDRAARNFERRGLTLEGAVSELLSRAAEDAFFDDALMDHDAWVRAAIEDALQNPSEGIPHEVIEQEWAEQRAALLAKVR